MSTRHGRRPGRLARRAVLGATAAWFATVGGVAGVSWLAIQSAGYAVTGSRVIGISLDAPPAVAAHPTAASTARPGAGTASTSHSATATRTGHGSSSASVTASVPSTPASVGATTAPGGGQGSHNGGRGGGSSTGAAQAGGQNPPAGGQSTTTEAPTSSVGSRTNGSIPTSPSTTAATTASSASSSSSQSGSGATSQSTQGGLVVAECTGDLVHWSVEPASGWSTLQSQKIEHGVKTGFRRSERVVAVTITCEHGSPTIDVRTTSSD